MRKIIDHDIGLFLDYLSDAKGKSFTEMYKTDFHDMLSKISRSTNSIVEEKSVEMAEKSEEGKRKEISWYFLTLPASIAFYLAFFLEFFLEEYHVFRVPLSFIFSMTVLASGLMIAIAKKSKNSLRKKYAILVFSSLFVALSFIGGFFIINNLYSTPYDDPLAYYNSNNSFDEQEDTDFVNNDESSSTTFASSLVRLSAGGEHSLAIADDGTLLACAY